MTPAAIIRGAQADGVVLTLTQTGTIKATGDGAAVGRWLAAVREHKAQIIDLLVAAANDPSGAAAGLAEFDGDLAAGLPEDLREAFEERAAIMEFDGGLSREEAERQAWQLVSREWQATGTPCGGAAGTPCGGTTTSSNPDCWAWPHSSAMNSTEIDTMQARLVRFTNRGLSMDAAEQLAEGLMQRDRDGWQARVSCFECRHLQGMGRWRCANWRQADVPQAGLARDLVLNTARCAGFAHSA